MSQSSASITEGKRRDKQIGLALRLGPYHKQNLGLSSVKRAKDGYWDSNQSIFVGIWPSLKRLRMSFLRQRDKKNILVIGKSKWEWYAAWKCMGKRERYCTYIISFYPYKHPRNKYSVIPNFQVKEFLEGHVKGFGFKGSHKSSMEMQRCQVLGSCWLEERRRDFQMA